MRPPRSATSVSYTHLIDTYTQVRMIVSDEPGENWVLDENDVRHDLTVPSGPQTGVCLLYTSRCV